MSKYPILFSFYSNLNKFNNLNPQKESTKKKNVTVYDNASELHNEYLEIYFYQYKALSYDRKRKLGNKYGPINLFLETYNYNNWFKNEERPDTTSRKSDKEKSLDLSDMLPLEGDEEKVKEVTG